MLDLAIPGRHKGHLLWLLTKSYTVVPLNTRKQVKMFYVWYRKKGREWDIIHEENYVIETQEELATVKKRLKQGKHTGLAMRMEHPRAYEIH